MPDPGRRPKITVVPVEPGFAEIMADGKWCVGVATAGFYMCWTVRLFAAPSARTTDAVPPYELGSLRAVRADVKTRARWWAAVAVMSREDYAARAAASAGGPALAAAELDVYCPQHGGYRDECGCPVPGPGQLVTVDSRFVPWPLPSAAGEGR